MLEQSSPENFRNNRNSFANSSYSQAPIRDREFCQNSFDIFSFPCCETEGESPFQLEENSKEAKQGALF